jgi:hypothetical protein
MMTMKKPIIDSSNIQPACGLCAHGRISPDNESVLCVNTGIRNLDSRCKKFKYDPLKRKPQKKPAEQPEFDKSDFEL